MVTLKVDYKSSVSYWERMWQTLQQFFPHLVTTRAINKTFPSVFYPTVIPVTPITHSWTFWKLLPYILRAATKKKERKTKKAITIQSHFMERAAPFPCLYKQQWNQHAQKPLTVSSGMAIVTCTGRSNFTKYTTVSLFPALVLDWGEAGGRREEQLVAIALQPHQPAAWDP